MTSTVFSALWYNCSQGKMSAAAISDSADTLNELHNISVTVPNSYYNNYKHIIESVTVEPIDCYTYDDRTMTLIPFYKSDTIFIADGAFYAINNYPMVRPVDMDDESWDQYVYKNIFIKDILVYLSRKNHEIWRNCSRISYDSNANCIYPIFFHDEIISNEIIPNKYYEEGIMNE